MKNLSKWGIPPNRTQPWKNIESILSESLDKYKIDWHPVVSNNWEHFRIKVKNDDGTTFILKDWKRFCPDYHSIYHMEYGKDLETLDDILILARHKNGEGVVSINWIERFTGRWCIAPYSVKRSKQNWRLYFINMVFTDPTLTYPTSSFSNKDHYEVEYDDWVITKVTSDLYESPISPTMSENWENLLKLIYPKVDGGYIFYLNKIKIRFKPENWNDIDIWSWNVFVSSTEKWVKIDNEWWIHLDAQEHHNSPIIGNFLLRSDWFLKYIDADWKKVKLKTHYTDTVWRNVVIKEDWFIEFNWKKYKQSVFEKFLKNL